MSIGSTESSHPSLSHADGLAENLALLQGALALSGDGNAGLPAVVDAAAADHGRSAIRDDHSGVRVGVDVAVLHQAARPGADHHAARLLAVVDAASAHHRTGAAPRSRR